VTGGDPAGVAHLYVHLPFCAARCGYCAFVVEVGREDARDAYLDALIRELHDEARVLGPLATVYLGGGTPSLMGADRLVRLLGEVRPLLAPGAEVSMEANPETVDADLLAAIAEGGVTRLSLGVQSSRAPLLGILDRRATPDDAARAVELARASGIGTLSVDFILAVPGQSPADLAADLAWVRDASPDHVSWYELEFKEGSAIARGDMVPADEDLAADLYLQAVGGLEDLGYRWYELANFAREGAECRHSLAYWGARDYLGIGVGAVSTIGEERRRNAPGLDRYLTALGAGDSPPRTRESLDADTRRRERWMLGTRVDRDLDTAWAGPPDHPEAMQIMETGGLIETGPGTVRLTRRGRLLQNAVMQQLMDFA
jgi:oxygen-independent coproporphyrinogen-3 oxidase